MTPSPAPGTAKLCATATRGQPSKTKSCVSVTFGLLCLGWLPHAWPRALGKPLGQCPGGSVAKCCSTAVCAQSLSSTILCLNCVICSEPGKRWNPEPWGLHWNSLNNLELSPLDLLPKAFFCCCCHLWASGPLLGHNYYSSDCWQTL